MQIIRTRKALREWTGLEREEGQTVALIPTMGALHEGHLSLVEIGRRFCTRAVVSIFVNPTQFGPGEDFEKYPRTEEGDLAALEKIDADAVYMPAVQEIYPEGFATTVSVEGIGAELEGQSRPGHFDGVATVVAKLLLQCLPEVAVFGEKDYQQLHIIRRVAADLDIPVAIMGGPIVREADGLAMSSRNRYLSKEERATAPKLHAILQDMARIIREGKSIEAALESGKKALSEAGFQVDYLELRDAETLQSMSVLTVPGRLLAAARLGVTRLIDNVSVE